MFRGKEISKNPETVENKQESLREDHKREIGKLQLSDHGREAEADRKSLRSAEQGDSADQRQQFDRERLKKDVDRVVNIYNDVKSAPDVNAARQKKYSDDYDRRVGKTMEKIDDAIQSIDGKIGKLDEKNPDHQKELKSLKEQRRELGDQQKMVHAIAADVQDYRIDKQLSRKQEGFESAWLEAENKVPVWDQLSNIYTRDFVRETQDHKDALEQRCDQLDARMNELEKAQKADSPEYSKLQGERADRGRDLVAMDEILTDAKEYQRTKAVETSHERLHAPRGESGTAIRMDLQKDKDCVQYNLDVIKDLEKDRDAAEAKRDMAGVELVKMYDNAEGKDVDRQAEKFEDLCMEAEGYASQIDSLKKYNAKLSELIDQGESALSRNRREKTDGAKMEAPAEAKSDAPKEDKASGSSEVRGPAQAQAAPREVGEQKPVDDKDIASLSRKEYLQKESVAKLELLQAERAYQKCVLGRLSKEPESDENQKAIAEKKDQIKKLNTRIQEMEAVVPMDKGFSSFASRVVDKFSRSQPDETQLKQKWDEAKREYSGVRLERDVNKSLSEPMGHSKCERLMNACEAERKAIREDKNALTEELWKARKESDGSKTEKLQAAIGKLDEREKSVDQLEGKLTRYRQDYIAEPRREQLLKVAEDRQNAAGRYLTKDYKPEELHKAIVEEVALAKAEQGALEKRIDKLTKAKERTPEEEAELSSATGKKERLDGQIKRMDRCLSNPDLTAQLSPTYSGEVQKMTDSFREKPQNLPQTQKEIGKIGKNLTNDQEKKDLQDYSKKLQQSDAGKNIEQKKKDAVWNVSIQTGLALYSAAMLVTRPTVKRVGYALKSSARTLDATWKYQDLASDKPKKTQEQAKERKAISKGLTDAGNFLIKDKPSEHIEKRVMQRSLKALLQHDLKRDGITDPDVTGKLDSLVDSVVKFGTDSGVKALLSGEANTDLAWTTDPNAKEWEQVQSFNLKAIDLVDKTASLVDSIRKANVERGGLDTSENWLVALHDEITNAMEVREIYKYAKDNGIDMPAPKKDVLDKLLQGLVDQKSRTEEAGLVSGIVTAGLEAQKYDD